MLHLDGLLVRCQHLKETLISRYCAFGLLRDDHGIRDVDGLLWSWDRFAGLVGKTLRARSIVRSFNFLVVLFSIRFVLLTVLSLSPTVRVANFDTLKLILDGPHLVLDAIVFHLQFENANDILDLGVVFHGELLRKRQITHKFPLKLVHSLTVSVRDYLGLILTGNEKLGVEVFVLQIFDNFVDQIIVILTLLIRTLQLFLFCLVSLFFVKKLTKLVQLLAESILPINLACT